MKPLTIQRILIVIRCRLAGETFKTCGEKAGITDKRAHQMWHWARRNKLVA